MPIQFEKVQTGGDVIASPFLGPVDHTTSITIKPSNFTTAEVDPDGYLKPGVPLQRNGKLRTGVDPEDKAIFGATVESAKIAKSNSAADLAAAPDLDVAVALIAVIKQKVAEDQLGRAYTAAELAGFALPECKIKLVA